MCEYAQVYGYGGYLLLTISTGDPRLLEEFESQGRKYLQQIQKDRTTARFTLSALPLSVLMSDLLEIFSYPDIDSDTN